MTAKTKSTPMKMVSLQGTAFEVGRDLFGKVAIPCLGAIAEKNPSDVQQFYCGLLSAAMGSLTADFGHEHATFILHTLVDSFATFGHQIPGVSKH